MNMKLIHTNVRTAFTASLIAVVALAVIGIQQVQAMFKKVAAEGADMRVSEVDACAPATADAPHFSGCSSIL